MSQVPYPTDAELKTRILAILDESRVMTLATTRPDGWPQATMVGYAHDDLAIYFSIARTSQKFTNIQRDPRVSIALGQDSRDHIRGLSMAARVLEVQDLDEIQRLNGLLHQRYPEQAVFAPREASSAIMRATPKVISVIDMSKGPGQPLLVTVESETVVRRLATGPE